MRKVLFATDFSDSAEGALSFLAEMIEGREIEVDLIHVFDIPIPIASAVTHKAMIDMIKERRHAVKKQLRDVLEQFPKEQRGNVHAIHGAYPSTEISELAEEEGVDFIIMAMRQKYSLFDKIIGSSTAHTIQKSDIPVLAIPNGAKYSDFKSILFPTNMNIDDRLEGQEKKALEWLYNFWELFDNPEVNMIHVTEDESVLESRVHNKPFAEMEFIVTSAESVEKGILNYLEDHNIDLIAVYKPNRGFWERLYHSSVTRKLLIKSRIPLLVF